MYSSQILLYFLLLISLGCRNKNQSEPSTVNPITSSLSRSDSGGQDNEDSSEEYPDGEYCASIDYYNPDTGTQSTYTLTVEVSGGELVLIHWPNGGWLDDSHFNPPTLESDGSCEFTSYEGKQYDIQIEEEGSCGNYSREPVIEQEKQEDENLLENTEEESSEETEVVAEEDNVVVKFNCIKKEYLSRLNMNRIRFTYSILADTFEKVDKII